jgi:hypothetical protein
MFRLAVVKQRDDWSIFSVKIELYKLFGLDGVQTRCIGLDSLESNANSGRPMPLYILNFALDIIKNVPGRFDHNVSVCCSKTGR